MITDINVSLGQWPFREFSVAGASVLTAHLQREGIDKAFVRSCRAAFLPEPEYDNRMLTEQLTPTQGMIPVPTINPMLRGWEGMADFATVAAVNTYPAFHCYKISSRQMAQLATACVETDTVLFITMRMEDPREMHPHCTVPAVATEDVAALADQYPSLPIVCLNAGVREATTVCSSRTNVYVDIAYAEKGSTIRNLLSSVTAENVLFGSHTPFFYTGAGVMKLNYGDATEYQRRMIARENAVRIFSSAKQGRASG